MKKQTIIAILALVMLFTFNSNASALTLVGWVNPVLDGGSFTTGTATYTITVGPGEGLATFGPFDAFSLKFPGTAFTSVSSFTDLSGIGGWSGSFGGGEVTYNGSLSAGSSFSFSVRFTLAGLGTVDPLFNT
ncbi:MAG: hypothetical protein ACE5IR_21200, partial [bacterium]